MKSCLHKAFFIFLSLSFYSTTIAYDNSPWSEVVLIGPEKIPCRISVIDKADENETIIDWINKNFVTDKTSEQFYLPETVTDINVKGYSGVAFKTWVNLDIVQNLIVEKEGKFIFYSTPDDGDFNPNGSIVLQNLVNGVIYELFSDESTDSNNNRAIETAISAPTGVIASDGANYQFVNLSWKSSANAVSYEVWRAPSSSPSSLTKIGTTKQTSYSDNNCVTGGILGLVKYNYHVKAKDFWGFTSNLSAGDQGWSLLNIPIKVSASDGDPAISNSLYVKWDLVCGATSYVVKRGTTGVESSASIIGERTSPPLNDTGRPPGVKYWYWVQAKTSGGTSLSNWDTGYSNLNAPIGVNATDGSFSDRVVVSWSYVPNASHYQIWRNTTNSSNSATQIAEVEGEKTISYDDKKATPAGTIYYYWVKAKKTQSAPNVTVVSALSTFYNAGYIKK